MISSNDVAGVVRRFTEWSKEPKSPSVKAELERLNFLTIKEISPRPMKKAEYAAVGRGAGLTVSNQEKTGAVTVEEVQHETITLGATESLYVDVDGKVRPDRLRIEDALRRVRRKIRSAEPPKKHREALVVKARRRSKEPSSPDEAQLDRLARAIEAELDQAALEAVREWQDSEETIDAVAGRRDLDVGRVRACWDRLKYRATRKA
jgi:hypothetical protein